MPLIREIPAAELSPYIAQHRDNPVDWRAWGGEAFDVARERDQPVFVSIGYSSCHWCHVMAHESFEDPATASAINERFIAIKVDREERPDVDTIYMEAVQAITGRGGWPLTVFLTPDGRPFYGGTYFPKTAQAGAPAFTTVLDAIATAWTERRQQIIEQADELTGAVASRLTPPPPTAGERTSGADLITGAVDRFAEMYDPDYGGIGRAPKFPQAPMLELVLRAHLRGDARALPMLTTTLEAMASGGIYDHLGGGFSRYSVDRFWLVPHFEKMLYDQTALARVYLHTWQVTGDPRWLQVVNETIGYLLRDMRDQSGGIHAAEDADSLGAEGLFYTWTPDEIVEVLGDDAPIALSWYGVTEKPNFEDGRSILYRPERGDLVRPDEVEVCRRRLFAERAVRQRPGVDDKVITEWNAMACSLLSEAAAATGNTTWAEAAVELGEVLHVALRRDDGRLCRSLQAGRPQHLAVAADYAWVVDCFTRLGELTGRAEYTARAVDVADDLIALFSAPDGGWYVTGSDAEALVVRPVDTYDGVTPAAGSVAATALSRLGALTTMERFTERAKATIAAAKVPLEQSPIAFSHLIVAALGVDEGTVEIVVAGSDPDLVERVQRRFLPESVLAWGQPTESGLWFGRDDGRAYVCEGGSCRLPTGDPNELDSLITATIQSRRA